MKTQLFTMVMICFFYGATAQVGVNTTSPEQTLDVNGKVRVGDDTNDATAGTMRFNNSNNDFEGYNGTSWNSLTQSTDNSNSLGPLPKGAIPVIGRIVVSNNNELANAYLETYGSQSSIFQQIPDGKALMITSISVEGNQSEYHIFVGRLMGTSGAIYSLTNVEIRTNGPSETQHLSDPFGLLTIIPSGSYCVGRMSSGPQAMSVRIRGFLVDDSFTY